MSYRNGHMRLKLIMIIREKALFKRLNDNALVIGNRPVFDEENNSVYWGTGKYHLTKDQALEEMSDEFKYHLEEVFSDL